MRKIIKKVILTLVLELAFLFIAMIISFLISRVLPGDPVLAYLPFGHIHPELYDAMYHHLGFDQPIIEQFFMYVGDMLSGNWGFSLNISRGYPVYSLIMERIPSTLTLLILPLILGLFLGFILGNYSIKIESRKGVTTVQTLSILGFAIPIILLAMSFQFFLSFINPVFDLVLLWIALTISITALTTLLVRIYLVILTKEASEKHSTIAFILLVGFSYGIVLTFLMQTEIMFSFEGIGDLFLQAISSTDYYVMNVIIFFSLISFPIFIMLILLLFFQFGKVKKHHILGQTNIT
jgi:peptide/nickel transport system permease protein